MDPELEALYERCPRYDEGEIYRTEEDDEAEEQKLKLYLGLASELNPQQLSLLDKLEEVWAGITELECRHYFQEGYQMGREGK